MSGSTTNLAMPYPTGTNRVTDGDNAIQSLAERIEARMPWGFMAQGDLIGVQGSLGNGTDLSGTNLTVTMPANRRIKISGLVMLQINGTYSDVRILQDNIRIGLIAVASPGSTLVATCRPEICFVPTAGVHSYKLQVAVMPSGVGQTIHAYDYPGFFRIEDIGPA